MTGFHNWDDVKHELFDTDELTSIEQGAARRLAGVRLGEIRQSLGLTQATAVSYTHLTLPTNREV